MGLRAGLEILEKKSFDPVGIRSSDHSAQSYVLIPKKDPLCMPVFIFPLPFACPRV